MGALVNVRLLEMAAIERNVKEFEQVTFGSAYRLFLTQKHYILTAYMKQVSRRLFQQIEPMTFHRKVRALCQGFIQLFRERLSTKVRTSTPQEAFPFKCGKGQTVYHKVFWSVKVIHRSLIAQSLHLSAVEYGIMIHSDIFYPCNRSSTVDFYQATFNCHYLSFLSVSSVVAYVLTLCRTTLLETAAHRRLAWKLSHITI